MALELNVSKGQVAKMQTRPEEGMEVVATESDGDAALAAIEHLKPDVAVLDIRMPGRDGISTLQELRARGHSLPVILLTAQISSRQVTAANEVGVEGIVLKQGGSDVLSEAIRTVVACRSPIETA